MASDTAFNLAIFAALGVFLGTIITILFCMALGDDVNNIVIICASINTIFLYGVITGIYLMDDVSKNQQTRQTQQTQTEGQLNL